MSIQSVDTSRLPAMGDQHAIQLSWSGNGNRAGNIVDQNSQVENAEYSVLITDTGNGNAVLVCDPPVKNVT